MLFELKKNSTTSAIYRRIDGYISLAVKSWKVTTLGTERVGPWDSGKSPGLVHRDVALERGFLDGTRGRLRRVWSRWPRDPEGSWPFNHSYPLGPIICRVNRMGITILRVALFFTTLHFYAIFNIFSFEHEVVVLRIWNR